MHMQRQEEEGEETWLPTSTPSRLVRSDVAYALCRSSLLQLETKKKSAPVNQRHFGGKT